VATAVVMMLSCRRADDEIEFSREYFAVPSKKDYLMACWFDGSVCAVLASRRCFGSDLHVFFYLWGNCLAVELP